MPHRTIYQKSKTAEFQLTQISISHASLFTTPFPIRFLHFLDQSHRLQAAYLPSWPCDVTPSFIMSKLSMNSMVAWSALHLTKCHLSTHKLAVICMATARTLSQEPGMGAYASKKTMAKRPQFLTLMTRTMCEFARHEHMASAIRL